jgi:hypothetical protein
VLMYRHRFLQAANQQESNPRFVQLNDSVSTAGGLGAGAVGTGAMEEQP